MTRFSILASCPQLRIDVSFVVVFSLVDFCFFYRDIQIFRQPAEIIPITSPKLFDNLTEIIPIGLPLHSVQEVFPDDPLPTEITALARPKLPR